MEGLLGGTSFLEEENSATNVFEDVSFSTQASEATLSARLGGLGLEGLFFSDFDSFPLRLHLRSCLSSSESSDADVGGEQV